MNPLLCAKNGKLCGTETRAVGRVGCLCAPCQLWDQREKLDELYRRLNRLADHWDELADSSLEHDNGHDEVSEAEAATWRSCASLLRVEIERDAP